MSINTMKLALEALENASPAAWASRVDSDTMKSIWRKHAEALEGLRVLLAELDNASCKSAQKRLEAQQPSSKEHLFELWWEAHMPNATQEQAWTAFTAAVASNCVGIAAQQPATGEPEDFPAGAIVNGRTLMERIEAYPFESEGGDLRMCSDWHELRRCFEHLADYVSHRPAPSGLGDDFDLICNAIDKADTITMEGDYMLDSDDCIAVVRVMQVLLSVRAAMLAAKDASA